MTANFLNFQEKAKLVSKFYFIFIFLLLKNDVEFDSYYKHSSTNFRLDKIFVYLFFISVKRK